jgi:pSer/pThr/pTyr-binding forkhead associated (FHA) protein
MAKLTISQDGNLIESRFIEHGTMTIGSARDNDVRLAGVGVSRKHARIVSVANDDILEDLDSANGTRVNGESVKQRVLKHDDIVEIAGFQLRYRNQKAQDGPSFDKTMVIAAPDFATTVSASPAESIRASVVRGGYRVRTASASRRAASLRDLQSANNAAVEIPYLLRTVGDAAISLAVINSRPHGYFITHVIGAMPARVNGESIGTGMRKLTHGDVIEVANERLEFVEEAAAVAKKSSS